MPLFEERDAPLLKTYLIRRLNSASEADPDTLSEYILALLRHDQPPEEVKQTCITQLSEFMSSDPEVFVKDVFQALKTKSYLPPVPQTRKRPADSPSQSFPNKFPRQEEQPIYALPIQSTPATWPGIPPSRPSATWPGQGPPPPGWNAFPPEMLHMVPFLPIQPQGVNGSQSRGPCVDYMQKGICLRGAACPYDHGLAPAVVSPTGEIEGTDAYDPLKPSTTGPIAGPISKVEIQRGPNHTDKTNKTLIVESIPSEHFNENSLRKWFSQFGDLKIQIDRSQNRAILTFSDHDSATKAWTDPRPVFNNRFVRIWWKKSDTEVPSEAPKDDVDIEEEKEKALKAQREYEERLRKKAELEKQKEELDRKAARLLEKQNAEKERLMEKIRRAQEKAKTKVNGASVSASPSPATPVTNKAKSPATTKAEVNGKPTEDGEKPSVEPEDDNSRKAQLRKMLSDLKNQANALKIPPSEYALPPLTDTRTRTTFSRGGYRGRGTYSRPYRGRGRGGMSRSLDLRPKSIHVAGILGTKHETPIREWLIMNCSHAIVETAPKDSLIINFKERYEAEEFLANVSKGPLGPLTATWHIPATVKVETPVETPKLEETETETLTLNKDEYDDEEDEGEIRESEGRWKR